MSKINWGKPIECDHGELTLLSAGSDNACVRIGKVEYEIYKDTGMPDSEFLPPSFTVRNKPSVIDQCRAIAASLDSDSKSCQPEDDTGSI